ncbi:MAG: CPBP family intramembrane glutamic endopeptidase [Polyangiaceae bacterium]
MRTALWLGIVTAVASASSYFAFQLERAGLISFAVILCVPTIILAVLGGWRAQRDGELMDWVRPSWGDATAGVMSAVVLFAASYAAAKLVAPTGSDHESWLARFYLQLGNPLILRANGLVVALILIALAAADEVLWRGFVTRIIAERVGSRTAWLYAAVPYALAQVPTMWALRDPVAGLNPLLPIAALGGGLVWGALARQQGRLVPGIISHALLDWCLLMMFRLWGPSV